MEGLAPLRVAYFHFLIHAASQRWLRFVWYDSVSVTGAPFWSVPVALGFLLRCSNSCATAAASGHSSQGLSGRLAMMPSRRLERRDQVMTAAVFSGFCISLTKSEFSLPPTFQSLGISFDTRTMSMFPHS